MVLTMKRWLKHNGLTIVATLLFLGTLVGQIATGLHVYNEDATQHGRRTLALVSYLGDGHFIEALFENWESEFLQMGLFVILTKYLRQKGSSESKKLEGKEEVDEDPREKKDDPEAPWPVKTGGVVLALYERSLSLMLFALFFVSFGMHAFGGMIAENEEQLRHGGETVTLFGYMGSAKFWFESFQNWQSEFFSVAALVVLSIFLRERGSPQSKPVAKAHHKTEAEA
jgi:hypothetical protein